MLKSLDSHGSAPRPEVFVVFDVCRWLVELVDGSPLLIAPWPF